MSNSISYDARPDLTGVQMNNGLTSVFVSVLSLAASSLAQTDQQRLLAVWLASRDQGVFGSGMVGFDISQLPWQPEGFADDQAFLLKVIQAAQARTGWERLDYHPHQEWVQRSLEGFYTLIAVFEIAHACHSLAQIWPLGQPNSPFEQCPLHQVYLHEYGCVICNDQ